MLGQKQLKWYHIAISGIAIRFLFLLLEIILTSKINGANLFGHIYRTDSRLYLGLAKDWYNWAESDGIHWLVVFFPLFPILIKYLMCFSLSSMLSSYIVSYLCFAFGLTYLFLLIRDETNQRIALLTCLFISIFPSSFFFGVPMTESLFLLTSCASLYYIRKHRWLIAGIWGCLAIMSRLVGIIIGLIYVIELILTYKTDWKKLLKCSFPLLIMSIGGLFYLYINYKYAGHPLRFLEYQDVHWYNHSQPYWQTINFNYTRLLTDSNLNMKYFLYIPNLAAFYFSLGLIAYMSIKKMPAVFIIYAYIYTAISFGVSWLLSGTRYTLTCIPLFFALAYFADKSKLRKVITISLSVVLLIIYFTAYLNGKPIY